MRLLLGFLLSAAAAFPGDLVSIGVKGGLPLTDAFSVGASPNIRYEASTKRYTVGPTFELHLPFGLGVEVDALYKRLSFESSSDLINGLQRATTANAWEFPLLLKIRLAPGLARPYVSVGPTFRHLSSINQVESFFRAGRQERPETSRPAELSNRFSAGFTASGGLELHAPVLEISPEIRYTRWGWENFRSFGNVLRSNDDQIEFLLGITF